MVFVACNTVRPTQTNWQLIRNEKYNSCEKCKKNKKSRLKGSLRNSPIFNIIPQNHHKKILKDQI